MVRRLALLTVSLLATALVLVPTVSAGDPCFHEMDNRPPTSTGATSQIAIGDCAFSPTVSRVATGTTVTWRNRSFQAHEVVGSNLTWGAHDKLLQPGETIAWTFQNPGVYAYSCMIHPGMTGAIIVGDVVTTGAAGTETETPGGGVGSIVAPLAVGGSLLAIAGLGLLVLRRRVAESQA